MLYATMRIGNNCEYFLFQSLSDLCFQYQGFWGLLDKIVYKNNQLECWVDYYHSFPPDYGCFSLDEIPTRVLYKALRIFKGIL